MEEAKECFGSEQLEAEFVAYVFGDEFEPVSQCGSILW